MLITFSPVKQGRRMRLTREQLREISALTGGPKPGKYASAEVVEHEDTQIVELYLDARAPNKIHTRHHIDADGKVFLTEECEPVDGDYNWEPIK